MIVAVLLTACCLVTLSLGSAIGNSETDSKAELEKLVDQIFSEQAAELSPDEVGKLLHRMNELATGLQNKSAIERSAELIELCQVGEDKCDYYFAKRFVKEERADEKYPKTILAYLKDCSRRQFELCKPKIAEELRLSLNKIAPESKSSAEMMVNSIIKDNNMRDGGDVITNENYKLLVYGLIPYLVSQGVPWAKLTTTEYKLSFKQYTKDLCNDVRRALAPSVEFVVPFANQPELKQTIDDEVLTWAAFLSVCRILDTSGDLYRQQTERILSPKNSDGKPRGSNVFELIAKGFKSAVKTPFRSV